MYCFRSIYCLSYVLGEGDRTLVALVSINNLSVVEELYIVEQEGPTI